MSQQSSEQSQEEAEVLPSPGSPVIRPKGSYYIDDSSSEEGEEKYGDNFAPTSYPNPLKNTKLDLHHAFVLEDLGIRLLRSAPVRTIYFRLKEEDLGMWMNSEEEVVVDPYKEYVHLLCDDIKGELNDQIEKVEQGVAKLPKLKKLVIKKAKQTKESKKTPVEPTKKEVLEAQKAKLEQLLENTQELEDKLLCEDVTSKVSQALYVKDAIGDYDEVGEGLSAISQAFNTMLKDNPDLADYVIRYHVSLAFEDLLAHTNKKDIHTSKPTTIAYSTKAQAQIKLHLYGSNQFGQALLSFYTDVGTHISHSQWKAGAVGAIKASFTDTEVLFDDDKQFWRLIKDGMQFTRPVLDDATVYDPDHMVASEEPNYSPACLLGYLRLTRCSIKRFTKNIETEDGFQGAVFSRGWQFDGKNHFSIIELQTLTPTGTLSTLLQYPYDSNYEALESKMRMFISSNPALNDKKVALLIKSILKTGKMPESVDNPHISSAFDSFLQIFTYHLFGVEVQRHPAAALHHAMAIDLVATDQKSFAEVFNLLPMVLKYATKVARYLQFLFRQEIEKEGLDFAIYSYDKSVTSVCDAGSDVLADFLDREQQLCKSWVQLQDKCEIFDPQKNRFDQDLANAFNGLCKDFFDIELFDV